MEFIDTTTPQSFAGYQASYGKTGDNDFYKQNWKDWSAMYYQNAYNTAMANYMNEYNTPLHQMLRYQAAGLNPYSVASQGTPGNMSSSVPGAAPKGSSIPVTSVQRTQLAMQSVNDLIGQAAELYDYIKYGGETHRLRNSIAQSQLSKYQSEADWSLYWNYGEGMGPNSPFVEGSPRARYMEYSTQRISAQVDQLSFMVDQLYPSQEAANKATAALNEYKKQIMEGQYGAVLSIDTGFKSADNILKLISFWIMNNASRFF